MRLHETVGVPIRLGEEEFAGEERQHGSGVTVRRLVPFRDAGLEALLTLEEFPADHVLRAVGGSNTEIVSLAR